MCGNTVNLSQNIAANKIKREFWQSYHVLCQLFYKQETFVEQKKARDGFMVDALFLWTEVVHVFHPLRPRAQIATETEGLHPETLSYPVLPCAEEFHHHKLKGGGRKEK